MRPATKSAIAASFCAGGIWPWTRPTSVRPRARARRRSKRSSAAVISAVSHLADQRADPVGLPALGDGAAQVVDHLGGAAGGDERGLDRLAAGRLLVEDREVHVAVLRQRQAARDRRRGHHQDVGGTALRAEVHALADAEAVLLVDDGEAEVVEGDVLLEERVGADEDGDLAGRERGELAGALGALVAAGQDVEPDAGGLGERRRATARCWRARISVGAISAAWPPASTAASMARSATSVLPEPTSPCSSRFIRSSRGHVGGDLGDGALLGAGQRVGQGGDHPVAQPAVAAGGEALGALHPGAGDGQRHLVGEELVVGEALAGRRGGREVGRAGQARGRRRAPRRQSGQPRRRFRLGSIHSGKSGRGRARPGRRGPWCSASGPGSADRPARTPAGPRPLPGRRMWSGCDHLRDAVEELDPAGDDAALAGGEGAAQPVGAGVEEDQLELGQGVADVDAVGAAADRRRAGAGRSRPRRSRPRAAAPRGSRGAGGGRPREVGSVRRRSTGRVDVEPGEEPGHLRPDPVEGGQLGEEREEDVRAAHRGGRSAPRAANGAEHPLDVRRIGLRGDAVAEVEDVRAAGEGRDGRARGAVERGAAGDQKQRVEVALDAEPWLQLRGPPKRRRPRCRAPAPALRPRRRSLRSRPRRRAGSRSPAPPGKRRAPPGRCGGRARRRSGGRAARAVRRPRSRRA